MSLHFYIRDIYTLFAMASTSTNFFDLDQPTAFTSVYKIHKATKKNKKQIKKELLKLDAYRLHHPAPKKFKRRRVISPLPNYIWGMDLVEIKNKKSNYNKAYVLTCIDFFDRSAWFETLKTKKGEEVLEAFKKIMLRSGRKPRKITSDHGRELKNRFFQKYCEDNNITQYFTNSPLKCTLCERLNRTLFQIISKYMTHFKTKRFVHKLSHFENIYNHTYHRSIGMSPASVNKDNIAKVYNNLYGREEKSVKSRLHVGDTVLRRLDKPLFTKGYSQTFESEPFTVKSVRNTNPPTYMLENTDGQIARAYYEKELLKI